MERIPQRGSTGVTHPLSIEPDDDWLCDEYWGDPGEEEEEAGLANLRSIPKSTYTEAQVWFDMPEFIQENTQAIKRVMISFQKEEDIEAFNKVTGLNITMHTKGAFYPLMETEPTEYVKE